MTKLISVCRVKISADNILKYLLIILRKKALKLVYLFFKEKGWKREVKLIVIEFGIEKVPSRHKTAGQLVSHIF